MLGVSFRAQEPPKSFVSGFALDAKPLQAGRVLARQLPSNPGSVDTIRSNTILPAIVDDADRRFLQ